MSQPRSLLMLQFLAWVADRPRSYADVMEAWRSNCPRMSIWEDAVIEGLVRFEDGAKRLVILTAQGHKALRPAEAPALPANPDARGIRTNKSAA